MSIFGSLKPVGSDGNQFKFEKSDFITKVVVRTEDYSVFVGGTDKKLSKYDKDLNFVDSLEMQSELTCALTQKNLIFCGLRESKSL